MRHASLPGATAASVKRDFAALDGDLRLVLEHLPVVVLSATPEGRITMSEGRGLASLGLQPGDLVGRSILDVVRNVPELREQMARALTGTAVSGVLRIREQWYEYSALPRLGADGAVEAVVGSIMDVTARQRAEDERDRLSRGARRALNGERAARRRAMFLAQASRVLASSLDQETTLSSITHLVVPEIADGCIVDLVDFVDGQRPVVAYHELEREGELAQIARQVSKLHRKERIGTEPIFFPTLDAPATRGSPQDRAFRRELIEQLDAVSMACVPMRARGRALGVLTLFTVAKTGRRLDRDHVELATDLAVHAALAVDNARLYGEQTLAVQRRDEFLSVASHELRTPVTSLKLAVQALSRRLERSRRLEGGGEGESAPSSSPTPALQTSMLRTVERQSLRLAQLVENLLDVSRIATGQLSMQLDAVDLAQLTRDTANAMAMDVAQADCTIDVTADPGVVGRWDRLRLEQVVTNLLSNAIKYGRGKPVSVSVTTDGTMAALRVEDRGIGIPAELQTSIFDRFERAVSARHYGGFGLGLYIVKQIVTGLGGHIEVESTEGEGATFTVHLPLGGPKTSPEQT